jgi:quercetin dioxygenase-like cupin family protein
MISVPRVVAFAISAGLAGTLLAACGGGEEPQAEQTTLGEVIASEGAAVLMEAQSLNALDQPIAYPKGKQAQVSSEIEVLEPGQESGWRKYRVPVYVYVMEGTISVEYDAGVVKDFPAGSAFLQAKGIWHNISNKGDSRAQLLSVVMGVKGVTSMAER